MMSIVFLDQRISTYRIDSTGETVLTDTPLLIGDIGLQVVAAQAVPEHVTSVRVALSGMVGIVPGVEEAPEITVCIERNGGDTLGSGIMIFREDFNTQGLSAFSPLVVAAGDSPPVEAVLAGQIRYTLFVSATDSVNTILSGPVTFNGSAVTGTTI